MKPLNAHQSNIHRRVLIVNNYLLGFYCFIFIDCVIKKQLLSKKKLFLLIATKNYD